MRETLVAALLACVDRSFRGKARRFLTGLSFDELQFIAEFLGAWVLEPVENPCLQAGLVQRLAELQRALQSCAQVRREDQEEKMILLSEYLCRSGILESSMTARAANTDRAIG